MTTTKEPTPKGIQLLNEMKAVCQRVRMGEISYDEGKALTAETLKEYNALARVTAKKYGKKWYDLDFVRLSRLTY